MSSAWHWKKTWFTVSVRPAPSRLAAIIIAACLTVSAFIAWSVLTGSQRYWPVVGILLATIVTLLLLVPLTRSRSLFLIPAGAMSGVAIAEITAFVVIDGAAPGSDALLVFGVIGFTIGLAVGLAFASTLAGSRHSA